MLVLSPTKGKAMCEDYPCCGHTPSDPCDYSGPTSDDYFAAYERGTWDPYDDYYNN